MIVVSEELPDLMGIQQVPQLPACLRWQSTERVSCKLDLWNVEKKSRNIYKLTRMNCFFWFVVFFNPSCEVFAFFIIII